MKKLLWTSAMALTAAACMTACDDSSSGASNSIPEFKTEAALPDTCEMEVAKAGDTYFACFENKWIEVTDSATVEQFKEGLDEDEIKAKLEELEDQLKPTTPAKPKSSSSKKTDEDVDSSDSDEPESSASEECTGRRCNSDGKSSSSKKSDGGSGSGEGGSGEGGEGGSSPSSAASGSSATSDGTFKFLDGLVTWKNETRASLNEDVDIKQVQKAIDGAGLDSTNLASGLGLLIVGLVSIELGMDTSWAPLDDGAYFGYWMDSTRAAERIVTMSQFIIEGNEVYVDQQSSEPCGKGAAYFPRTYMCDDRGEGHGYKVYEDGRGLIWMVENLAYPTAKSRNDNPNHKSEYYYNWEDASTNGCPDGWELPTQQDWDDLFYSLGNDAKELDKFMRLSVSGYGNNGSWSDDAGEYWTATEYNDGAHRIARWTESGGNYTLSLGSSMYELDEAELSVRCVKK